MKCVRSFAVFAPSIALASVAAAAWFTLHSSAGATAVAPALDPADAAIKQAMEQMNDAMKNLSKGITADNKAASLDELTKFETAVIAAKSQTPGSAAKVDEKKRAAFVADYRKTLLDALKTACDAEVAIADGKYKDADKLISNKLSGVKSAGHSKFKEEGK
jgi:hypothetical protein